MVFISSKDAPLRAKRGFARRQTSWGGELHFLKDSERYNLEITSVEMPLVSERFKTLAGIGGDILPFGCERIVMAYSGLFRKRSKMLANWYVRRAAARGVADNKNNFGIALGCISTGAFGNENIISPGELNEDIHIAKLEGVKKAYIYSLQGLNREYNNVIERHAE